jgi:hypothetical protein
MLLWRLLYYTFITSRAFSSLLDMSLQTSSILLAIAVVLFNIPPFGGSGSIQKLGLKLSITSTGNSPVDRFFAWLLTNCAIGSQRGQSSWFQLT